MGPNGAGKSTLLSLLAGALPPSGGRVETPDPRLSVGWAPQRPALYGHLTARENVELFARLAGLLDPGPAAEQALAQVHLVDATQRAAQLSVGNQQRLNLALALLGNPDLLLLDEPTASLDPDRQRLVWELLLARRDSGQTALLATHTTEEAATLATRIVTLVEGAIVADEATA